MLLEMDAAHRSLSPLRMKSGGVSWMVAVVASCEQTFPEALEILSSQLATIATIHGENLESV